MRPLRSVRAIILLAALLGSTNAGAAQSNATDGRHSQPVEATEEIDLSEAQPETTIAPSAIYALPDEDIPDSVVVDLPHRKAYIASEFVAINILSLLAALWVEALALAVAMASMWWLRRLARRPQEIGRPYCRRCNYLLAHLSGVICPECGATVTGRGRLVGRRRWPRAMLATCALGGSVGLYLAFARRAPRLIWPDRWPAWWSRTLDDVAQANSKYEWLIQHSRVLSHLVEIDLDAGGAERTVWTGTKSDTDHINAMFLSEDASRLTIWHTDALQVWSLPGRVPVARLNDLSVSLPFSFLAITNVELSGDGCTALFVGPEPKHKAVAIDVDSGRQLWTIESLVVDDISSLRILHGSSLDRLIVAADISSTGVTDLSEWYVDDQQHPSRMRHITTSAYALGPRLVRNGLGPLIWASDIDHVEAWNLQTGRVEQRLALPQRSVLLFSWPGDVPRLIITMFDQDSRTWIVDTQSGRVLAQLDGTPLRTRSTEVLAGGRTLAVWGYDADFSHKALQLYDLSSIAPSDQDDR